MSILNDFKNNFNMMHLKKSDIKISKSFLETIKIMILSFFGNSCISSSSVHYKILREKFSQHLDIENIILRERENTIIKNVFLKN